MNEHKKNERDEKINEFVSKLNYELRNFLPNKRTDVAKEKEITDKLVELMDYFDNLEQSIKNGKSFSRKDIYDEIFSIFEIRFNKDELKKMIESLKLTQLLDINPEGTDIREYLVFINNLVEASCVNKINKDLEGIFTNIDLPEVMGFIQYLTSTYEDASKFLFKKPFRYTSKSVPKLIEMYGILSGYYETFVKLMISAYELVYENKPFDESKYKQLSKKNFSSILKLTKKIPEFDIFIKPYDRTLRNKIVHKDLRTDYNNKIVIYSSEKIPFEDLKINTRNLLAIFESVSYIYTFNIRKSLQKGYDLLNRDESHSVKN